MLLTVGKPFPGPVPETNGGAIFEIFEDGSLFLFIQWPNPSRKEAAALTKGFSSYSFYGFPEEPFPVIFSWQFEHPVHFLETPFHAGIYPPQRLQAYLDKAPEANNALSCVVLDGNIVKALRIVGLKHDAVRALHGAITLYQLQYQPLSKERYVAALDKVYKKFGSEELFMAGKRWEVS